MRWATLKFRLSRFNSPHPSIASAGLVIQGGHRNAKPLHLTDDCTLACLCPWHKAGRSKGYLQKRSLSMPSYSTVWHASDEFWALGGAVQKALPTWTLDKWRPLAADRTDSCNVPLGTCTASQEPDLEVSHSNKNTAPKQTHHIQIGSHQYISGDSWHEDPIAKRRFLTVTYTNRED